MYSRDANLQSVLHLLCRSVVADPGHSADAERTIGIVEQRLRVAPSSGAAMPDPVRLPVCALLHEALAARTPLLEAFRAVEPRLTWYQRKGDLGDDRFRACHAKRCWSGPAGWSRGRMSGSASR
jgi:hypothetical protein